LKDKVKPSLARCRRLCLAKLIHFTRVYDNITETCESFLRVLVHQS